MAHWSGALKYALFLGQPRPAESSAVKEMEKWRSVSVFLSVYSTIVLFRLCWKFLFHLLRLTSSFLRLEALFYSNNPIGESHYIVCDNSMTDVHVEMTTR